MNRANFAYLFLAMLVLAGGGVYFSLNFKDPMPGVNFDPASWRVIESSAQCLGSGPCLAPGDIMTRVGSVDRSKFLRNRFIGLEDAQKQLPVEFQRGEETLSVHLLASREMSVRHRIELGFTFLALLTFWLSGTLAVVLVRPRNLQRRLLILLCFDTVLWIATGSVSASQMAMSSVVFRVCVWLFFPLCLHLHLALPQRVLPRRHERWITPALYLCTGIFIVLDVFRWLPAQAFMFPVLAALVTSLMLLGRGLSQSNAPPPIKHAYRLMAYGMVLGFVPTLLLVLTSFALADHAASVSLILQATCLASIPIWPIAYGYAIYHHRLGSFELRSNRLLGTYAYVLLGLLAYCLLWIVGHRIGLVQRSPELFGLVLAMLLFAAAPVIQRRLQIFTDRLLIGSDVRPDSLLTALAGRLPTIVDLDGLKQILVSDILPSLMVHESGLYLYSETSELEIVLADHPEPQLGIKDLDTLADATGRFLRHEGHPLEEARWVRLALEITVEEQRIGVWLLGRRDPDDFYDRSEIETLKHLANQLSTMVRALRDRAEKQDLQELVIHSHKMEAVGRLSAGVAHDFNNMLSIIDMNSSMLREQISAASAVQRYITGIEEATSRASMLTRSLLTFSQHQIVRPKRVDLSLLLSRLESLLRSSAGSGVELRLNLTFGLPPVLIDPAQLERVIVNLTVNAKDAMNDSGQIVITTAQYSPAQGDGVAKPPTQVIMTISDNGPGIAKDIQSKIFDPFFSTKPPHRCSGLGLSLAYGVITQSGGDISLDSDAKKGATFRICLPAAPAEYLDTVVALAPRVPEAETRQSDGRHQSVLLVEDDTALRSVLGEALSGCGFRVSYASDGVEALSACETLMPDLLLTDIMMPNMNGIDLSRRLRQRMPDLKVLFISGCSDRYPDTVDDANSWLLPKPFSNQDLLRVVHDVLQPAKATN